MDVRERLLQSVRELEPAIRQAADEAEATRRMPATMLQQFIDREFLQMFVPRSLGGLEVDPLTAFEVVEAIARIDGSIGWVVMISSATPAFVVPYLPREVTDEVFSDPNAVMVGLIAPRGRAVPVEGGYRVSGRWPFGSGCQNATRLVSGTLVFDGDRPKLNDDGQPEMRLMLLPADECEVLDTRSVAGLRGSGSHDYVVNDLFVPEERAVAPIPERRVHDGHLYDIKFLLGMQAAQALGVARHAIDAFHEFASAVPHAHAMAVRERPMAQVRAAQAEALVASARAYIVSAIEDAWCSACSGRGISLEQGVQFRLANTNAVQQAAEAVDLMYDAAGAWSIYTENPLERCFRDIHVATQHFIVATPTYEAFGKVLLGVDDTVQFLH